MQPAYFFTGFPGFIANQLIPGIIEKYKDFKEFFLLVLPNMKESAEKIVQDWCDKYSLPQETFHIVVGDITKKGLGLSSDDAKRMEETVTHVFHLAAIYDLAVPQDIAFKVNVEGTNNVNQWVLTLQNLKRYTYFSTAYVAGTRTGILKEDELIRPPSFKNHYEETKYEAEVLVEELKEKVPVTIIRPGIVKGHSKTGETVKFDGPYMFLNLIDRLRNIPFFPKIGDPRAVVNLVPIDFIVDAVLFVSHNDIGEGKTYHMTDPNPYSVGTIYSMFLSEMLGKKPRGRLPLLLLRFFLSFAKIRQSLRIEKEALDYLTWLGRFDATEAQKDLQLAGIQCPDLKDQIPSMVHFYLENKEVEEYHIKIR